MSVVPVSRLSLRLSGYVGFRFTCQVSHKVPDQALKLVLSVFRLSLRLSGKPLKIDTPPLY